MTDHEAMLAIQEQLDGVEWTAETLECIAEILRQTGYRIRDLDDRDTGADLCDPKEPAPIAGPGHVVAILREDHVRDQIAGILETECDFGDVTSHAVGDEEIHSACLSVAATIDLSEEIGNAEFRAGLKALDEARRRHADRS